MFNPIQMLFNQFQNNPLFAMAQQMSNGKNQNQMQTIMQNVCKQKGINIDEAYQEFLKQFPMFK